MDSTSHTIRRPEPLLLRIHGDESGSMMAVMVMVVAILLLVLVLVAHRAAGMIGQVGRSDAADRAAARIGSMRADAMNRLVDANHDVGERLAWAISAAAVSGRRADREDLPAEMAREADGLDGEIGRLASELLDLGGEAPAAGATSRRIEAGAATGEARLVLKRALAEDYRRRVSRLILSASGLEREVLDEWGELDRIEREARDAVAAIDHLVDRSVPRLLGRAAAIADRTPGDLAAECERLGLELDAEVGIDPASLGLPVEEDRAGQVSTRGTVGLARSQVVASAWPWVRYHRMPILDRLERLRRSGAAGAYREWTERMCLKLAAELIDDGAPRMLVLADAAFERGGEPWRADPTLAARRFAAVVLVLRSSRGAGSGLLRDQHPKGWMSHAQVIIHPRRIGPSRAAPWDTLSWNAIEPDFPDDVGVPTRPLARPSWTSRLTPVTRLNEVAPTLPDPIRGPALRVTPAPRSLQTH